MNARYSPFISRQVLPRLQVLDPIQIVSVDVAESNRPNLSPMTSLQTPILFTLPRSVQELEDQQHRPHDQATQPVSELIISTNSNMTEYINNLSRMILQISRATTRMEHDDIQALSSNHSVASDSNTTRSVNNIENTSLTCGGSIISNAPDCSDSDNSSNSNINQITSSASTTTLLHNISPSYVNDDTTCISESSVGTATIPTAMSSTVWRNSHRSVNSRYRLASRRGSYTFHQRRRTRITPVLTNSGQRKRIQRLSVIKTRRTR